MSPNPPQLARRSAARGPLRVQVYSADPSYSAALAQLFASNDDVELTGQADAQVVLWDAGPGATTSTPTASDSASPALILVPAGADPQAALDAGAAGVISRDSRGEHVVDALLAVHAGLTVLGPDAAVRMRGPSAETTASSRPPPEPLTAREKEVLALLVEGLSNRRIAKRLEISEHTAKFHVNRILLKFDADSRTEAVVRALRLGLVKL